MKYILVLPFLILSLFDQKDGAAAHAEEVQWDSIIHLSADIFSE